VVKKQRCGNKSPLMGERRTGCRELGRGPLLKALPLAAQDLELMAQVDVDSIRDISKGELQQALHRYGVVLAGFRITDKWSAASADGWIAPGGTEIGGHAVVLCGYSQIDTPPWYAFQNSWGEGQGWRGFNRMTPEVFNQQFDYGLVWDFRA
jgi:C1A family cysteine protease